MKVAIISTLCLLRERDRGGDRERRRLRDNEYNPGDKHTWATF